MKKLPNVEWSFPVEAERIGDAGATYKIKPNEAERKALAERMGLLSLDALSADINLTRERGGLVVHVTGTLRADLTQECVVTLEPVKNHVEDSFEAFYSDSGKAVSFALAKAEIKAKHGEPEVEMIDERDAPEPLVDGVVDLGELVSQYLSLAIDPYPRKPGLPEMAAPAAPEQKIESPFAALREWKDKL